MKTKICGLLFRFKHSKVLHAHLTAILLNLRAETRKIIFILPFKKFFTVISLNVMKLCNINADRSYKKSSKLFCYGKKWCGIKQENQQITGDGVNTYSNLPFYIKRTNRPISFDSVLSSINFDCTCPPSMSENPRNSWNNPYNHDAYLIRIKVPSGW